MSHLERMRFLEAGSDALLRRRMRLSALVTLCTVACRASTDEGSALCRKRQAWGQIELIQKRTRLNSRAKHTIETSYTPEKLPTHRPERLHRAHYLLEHNAVTRRSPRRPRRRRRTATTPSRARRSPRSTRTRPTRCARPSRNCPTSSSRPSSSASRTTSWSL